MARSLPPDSRKIIDDDIKTVQFGWPIGLPLVRKMGPGLREVRSNLADGLARTLFTTDQQVTVLLHGIIKKTRQTPQRDVALARKRMKAVQHGQEPTHP